MPSLKMKTKSSTECLIEKNCLHVCQKSTVISKTSYCCLRSSPVLAELDTCIQDCWNVSPSTEVSVQDVGRRDEAVAHEDFLDTENLQLQKQELFFSDPTNMGKMETPTHCQSNIETIFSPNLDLINETNVDNNAGSNGDPDMPQLRADDSHASSRSSRDYQTCNVSDFYISDMIVAGIPFDGNPTYKDIAESNPYPDHECADSLMLFDMDEHYMILPFLEEPLDTSNTQDDKSVEETLTESDTSGFYSAIHQLKSCDQDSDVTLQQGSDQSECYDPLDVLNDLPDLSDVSTFRPAILPKELWKKKPVTLVLDLDETLVHSSLEQSDDADFTFPVFFNMKEHIVHVKRRPFLQTFLERVSEMFDIVVFTASQSIYAEQLLDILDPDGKLICRRFYRESCIFSDGSYTKDLTVLGVDLAKAAIIDNSPQVFQLQVNNGIPIKSWFDDPSDRALISLLPFLETLVDAEDVRPIIAKKFGNME